MERHREETSCSHSLARLNELGYEEELVRGLSFWGILGMGIGIICLPATVYAITVIAVLEGGAVSESLLTRKRPSQLPVTHTPTFIGFLYGWVAWGLITIPIVMSMGEMCST